MRLFIMRHGQTNYNVRGLCNDDPSDEAHLTDLGRQQAAMAAEQLKTIPLQRIYVSELPRTRQTAAIVNRFHDVAVEAHPALNDIRSGFNNRPVRDYQAAIAHDPLRARVNGGESLLDHKQRVLQFIEWLKAQPLDTALVVAHEETLRVFAAHFRGLDDETMRRLAFGNCEVAHYQA